MSQRKRSKKCPDAHAVFRIAIAFTATSHAIANQFGECPPDCIAFPLAVNHALSLELYLKCLILIEKGTHSDDHDLKKLFHVLPVATREKARKYYDKIRNNDPMCQREAERIRQEGEDPEDDFALKAALKHAATAFVRCRYPYEEGSDFNYALVPLEIAIRRIILEHKPEWSPALIHQQQLLDTPPTSQHR
jgi:hypothetical protein